MKGGGVTRALGKDPGHAAITEGGSGGYSAPPDPPFQPGQRVQFGGSRQILTVKDCALLDTRWIVRAVGENDMQWHAAYAEEVRAR